MESQELASVVVRISEDVTAAGFPDRAALLQGWAEDLRSGDPEREADARDELRKVIHGMGGLIDMLYGEGYDMRRVELLSHEIKVEP